MTSYDTFNFNVAAMTLFHAGTLHATSAWRL